MSEPLSLSMIVGGLVLGTTFAIGSTVVGKIVQKIDEAVYRYQHPNPKEEREKELKDMMKIINQYDKPETNLNDNIKLKK